MSLFASPLQIATVVAAVSWPFAAGLGVVLWSKARAAGRARRQAALDSQLHGMFRAVEARGVPQRLAMVVEAMEEHEALTAAAKRAKTTSKSSATT
jgi:uncharacterized iron-regulated membrane protein